jgi:rare lipoprotein A
MEMWLMAAAAAVLFSLHGCSSRPAHAPEPPVLPKPPAEASAPASRPDQARPYRALGQWYQPILDPRGFRQQGTASWYGTDFHGKRASSGEVYNMHDMTAAHKTLPMGTLVRVRNLDNSRTVEVRINDRGPFVRDRIIDLSHEAARRIGMIGPGTAPVEIVAIGIVEGSPTDLYSGNFTFQIGAFTNRENAERLRAQLDSRYGNAHIQEFNRGDRMFYRLRVGRAGSLDEAIATEATLMRDGFSEVFTVAE